jgi:hypothetical protein
MINQDKLYMFSNAPGVIFLGSLQLFQEYVIMYQMNGILPFQEIPSESNL